MERENLDPGIKRWVEILNGQGVMTFESCEGGEGHSFPEPTIRFHGNAVGFPRINSRNGLGNACARSKNGVGYH